MPAKGKKRKTKIEKEEELSKIAKFHARGKSERQIAKELEISQAWVNRCLKTIYDRWRDQTADARKRLLNEVNEVRQEAWDAWEKSKRDAEVKTLKIKKAEAGGQGSPVETSIRTEGQHGDTRYLKDVEWANEREGKIRGTDAPEKRIIRFDDLSDEELDAEIANREAQERTEAGASDAPTGEEAPPGRPADDPGPTPAP